MDEWVVWFYAEPFTLHLNRDGGWHLLSPIILVLVPAPVPDRAGVVRLLQEQKKILLPWYVLRNRLFTTYCSEFLSRNIPMRVSGAYVCDPQSEYSCVTSRRSSLPSTLRRFSVNFRIAGSRNWQELFMQMPQERSELNIVVSGIFEKKVMLLYLLLICSFLIFLTLSSFSFCFLALQKIISKNH